MELGQVLLLPFSVSRSWGSDRLNNLLENTSAVSGEPRPTGLNLLILFEMDFNLKNKTITLPAKMDYLRITENCNLRHTSYGETIGQSSKEKEWYFKRRTRIWKGLFWAKVHWKRARVQGGEGFSLAELQGKFSHRRCSILSSLLGLWLRILLMGSVIDSG